MKTTIAALSLLVAIGWAMVRTDVATRSVDRSKRPAPRAPTRQIKMLGETSSGRVIKHALGETTVPLAPERIVSLTSAGADSLAALGIRPALVTTSGTKGRLPGYLADFLEGVPTIRQTGGINLEAVLAARPDLILADSRDARVYSQLSKIAPTVCFASDASGGRERRILDVGDVVGRSEQAQRRLAEFVDRVAEAKTILARTAGGQPVAFLRFRRNTCVVYTQTDMFGPLLFDSLGLTPDPAVPAVMASGGWDVLSVERLSTLQAEFIFMVVDADSEAYLKQVGATPIWQDIPAVRHGHVKRVAPETWLGGDGVLGYEAILADVLEAMAPEGTHQ